MKGALNLSVALVTGLVLVALCVGAFGASSLMVELRSAGGISGPETGGGLLPFAGPGLSAGLSISPGQIDEGQSIHVSTTASGGDPSPSYGYEYSGMPDGCSFDEAPSFSCTPSQSGSYSIYVNVTDGTGNWTDSSSVALTVDPALTVELSVSPQDITEGQSVNIQTSAAGGSNSYSYSYFGLPSGCQGENNAQFQCTPSSTGSYNIYVNVTDTNGGYLDSPNQNLQVTPSSGNGGGSGSNGNGNGGNNSSNPFGSLLSGFSGLLSLFLIAGIIGFVTWILLIVGVWIIAVVLIRRLPKRGTAASNALAGAMSKCASCSATIPSGSKFCPECGASTVPKAP